MLSEESRYSLNFLSESHEDMGSNLQKSFEKMVKSSAI